MQCKTIISADCEECVTIYAHERTKLVEDIESMVNGSNKALVGYIDTSIYTLEPFDVHYFAVEENKLYAFTDTKAFLIKERLYSIENIVGNGFIKINQSCIANISKIERFEMTFGGALNVVFKNGRKDYISRRQLKAVKERIGFKL